MAGALQLNTSILTQGFGSYLEGILPTDIAIACGAFNQSMRQIRNIESVPVEKFAQIAQHIETTKGLNLINGTNVPTNTTLAESGYSDVALGSGPNGTYTASDFFGSMSGLPYAWENIFTQIGSLETSALYNIYKQLYLAVTWERATATIQYTGPDGFGNYTTTGVTLTDLGGGYGREGAVAPVVTVNGATVTATIGTDDTNITTFGRVTALNFTPGTTGSVPTISIDYPPGGSSFSNTIVQDYIDDANTEIATIQTRNPANASILNSLYSTAGTQLTIEQRSRYTGITPVPTPRSTFLSQYPTTLMAFIDSISEYAINTEPNMYAQTIEAISDLSTVGGQSLVGMMRQERNQSRLSEIGIQLDNNIPGELPIQSQKVLIANGTLPTANPNSAVSLNTGSWTIPGILPEAEPAGYYDSDTDDYILTDGSIPSYLGTLVAGPIDIAGRIPGNPTGIVDTGTPLESGALSKNPYGGIVDPQLNANYTSAILSSSRYTVSEAIDEVIKCNCDCWVD